MAKIETPIFPILGQEKSGPVGIARLACHAEHADDGHLVEFRALQVRSLLNRSVSKRLTWMAWSINPYRGCEFACRYCYARYTHEFMAPSALPSAPGEPDFHDPLTFERLIFLKQNAAWLLQQELRRFQKSQQIAIGTATDPWQPIERRARITRSILEVFANRSGYNIGIVTKSRLILRDTDLLREIGQHNRLVVHITITTPDAELARLLEPRAPRPDLRLETVRRLREAGIVTGILCSPLLPGITDTEEAIDRMAALSAKANASFFAANPLFLKPCSRPTYLSFVREHYPALVADYERRFARNDFAAKPYAAHLSHLVSQARERHGLNRRWREEADNPGDSLETTNRSDPRPLAPVRSAGHRTNDPHPAPAQQQLLFDP
ncbi:MAG: radical SAM protein [Edaphobacter sp.]|uniref:SPL family radical SAM protein n=1 Tax=Edaphobacter sp. TaxID=1934404 RepID=UPI002383C4DC|nr:radical SAM protein [Edaphobacter sp.]MDE1177654.1 radical SAM protein [Edaphobacter sp.]